MEENVIKNYSREKNIQGLATGSILDTESTMIEKQLSSINKDEIELYGLDKRREKRSL